MFPILLDLKGKRAVVFGGGKIANRRVMKLLDAEAKVTVVSRDFHPGLKRRKGPDLKLVKREIKKGSSFIENSDIVLIATDDAQLNDRLEKEARMLKKIVNRADVASDFIIPATIKTGDITVSISTDGKSPAVAKNIKKRIKRVLTSEDQYLIDIEEFAREKLKKTIKNQNRREKFLRELINRSDIIEKMKNGDVNSAKRILESTINAYDKH